jgi:hypothetical protein
MVNAIRAAVIIAGWNRCEATISPGSGGPIPHIFGPSPLYPRAILAGTTLKANRRRPRSLVARLTESRYAAGFQFNRSKVREHRTARLLIASRVAVLRVVRL